jgi:hypothetical protein
LGWVEPAVHWLTEITREEASGSRTQVMPGTTPFPIPMEPSLHDSVAKLMLITSRAWMSYSFTIN